MTNIYLLEISTVLLCWAVAGYAIWKWGPGSRGRGVACPERKLRARVMAEQREAEFGCLRVAGVESCSLFPGEELTCSKACALRL